MLNILFPLIPTYPLPNFFASCCSSDRGSSTSPVLLGKRSFHSSRGWALNFFCSPFFFCPLEGHSRWRNQLWFHRITHGHLYLLLGEGWRRGEMIMCAQGWPEALGGGWGRPNWGQGRSFVGIFFTSSWPPALTDFDKRRNSKDKP